MPRTPKPKRPDGGLVELAVGVTIPADFTGSNELKSGGAYTMRIVTDPEERIPRVATFSLSFAEPPAVSDLADEQLRRLASVEIAIASAQVARSGVDDDDVLLDREAFVALIAERQQWHREHAGNVRELLQGRRGRPERTDKSKLEILQYWEQHGIAATVERFGLAERTIRRYIADAKQIKGKG